MCCVTHWEPNFITTQPLTLSQQMHTALTLIRCTRPAVHFILFFMKRAQFGLLGLLKTNEITFLKKKNLQSLQWRKADAMHLPPTNQTAAKRCKTELPLEGRWVTPAKMDGTSLLAVPSTQTKRRSLGFCGDCLKKRLCSPWRFLLSGQAAPPQSPRRHWWWQKAGWPSAASPSAVAREKEEE